MVTLVLEAKSLQFPRIALALGLQSHIAPRMLRAKGSVSTPKKVTGRSVLSGCSLSTAFCRAYLHNAVEATSACQDAYEMYQHDHSKNESSHGRSFGR